MWWTLMLNLSSWRSTTFSLFTLWGYTLWWSFVNLWVLVIKTCSFTLRRGGCHCSQQLSGCDKSGVKSYFLSQGNPPKVLAGFFNNPLGEPYLWFLHSQMALFQKTILQLERSCTSVCETYAVLFQTVESLIRRKEASFVPLAAQTIMGIGWPIFATAIQGGCWEVLRN